MGHGFRDEQFWKAEKAKLFFHFSGGTTAIKAWKRRTLIVPEEYEERLAGGGIKSVPKIFGQSQQR